MVSALFVFAFVAIMLVMSTLGAVLVVRFTGGAQRSERRVAIAAIAGPTALFLPAMGIMLIEVRSADMDVFIAVCIMLAIGAGAIGWPVAHFATRRLDRLTAFDPTVFE